MTGLPKDPGFRRRWAAVATAALAAAVVVAGPSVAAFIEARSGMMPPCQLRVVTGWHCPGCGGTRATLALMEHDLPRAASNNLLYVAVIYPLLAVLFLGWLRGRPLLPLRPWMIFPFVLLVAVFWLLRNLPAFAWLAPVAAGNS